MLLEILEKVTSQLLQLIENYLSNKNCFFFWVVFFLLLSSYENTPLISMGAH